MRRNPKSPFLEVIAGSAVFVVLLIVVVEAVSPILDVLVPQDLRPVRDVDWKRRCGDRRYATVSAVDGGNPLRDSRFGDRTAELRRGTDVWRVEEVGLVELEDGIATAVVGSVAGRKKSELGPGEVTLTSRHQRKKERKRKIFSLSAFSCVWI